MADLEDALSPTWANVIGGQAAIADATRGTLAFDSPDGKAYRLDDDRATLVVRPRGWHLIESHVLVDEVPVSASLFDFGLYLFHSGAAAIEAGSGPYLYLAKLESHHEARLWNDVFLHAQAALGIPRGSIRATVLIETILAAFEMDEILYELREHAAGLNAGRWDYLFSAIKKFRTDPAIASPDRAQLTMTVPFMRAYTELLVQTCHRRGGARDRRDGRVHPEPARPGRHRDGAGQGPRRQGTRERRRVRWDVGRPSGPRAGRARGVRRRARRPPEPEGPPARGGLGRRRRSCSTSRVYGGAVTEAGVRANVRVALAYLDSWLRGVGRGGHRQPHGGRRHRRDLPLPAVAVDHPGGHARRRRPVHAGPLRDDPRGGAGAARRPVRRAPRGCRGPARSPGPGRRLRRVPDPPGVRARWTEPGSRLSRRGRRAPRTGRRRASRRTPRHG